MGAADRSDRGTGTPIQADSRAAASMGRDRRSRNMPHWPKGRGKDMRRPAHCGAAIDRSRELFGLADIRPLKS